MIKVAVTGLNGVIGKILAEEIPSNLEIIDLFHRTKYSGKAKIHKHIKLDLLNKKRISKILEEINPDIIVHLAAITHIDTCEKDRERGKKGIVWKTNVKGTGEIAKFCAKNKIHLIFLSTECVFDGKRKYFSENSKKNPINWYGSTKSEAEELMLSSGAPVSIIRSVVAYHKNDNGKTIYGKILSRLRADKDVWVVSDQLFTPTYTYDIVQAINQVIKNKQLGIFHVAPGKSLSPYDLALIIARRNRYSHKRIKKTTLEALYGEERAALRLRNASLSGENSNRILKLTPASPGKAL